ncbi:MAG: hypothetical protein E3J35_09440 [Methanomassiliicoccales archaeon]|nr:MAG: hypothetical protein E3J35_09440 [Methanomassiliicoccales archaeon]
MKELKDIVSREQLTTITIRKPFLKWINSVKGIMEYHEGEKRTIEEAILRMCIYTDVLYGMRLGILDVTDDSKIEEFLEKRVRLIFEEDIADEIIKKVRTERLYEKQEIPTTFFVRKE